MKRDSELFAALFDHLQKAMQIACDLGLRHLCFLIGLAVAESSEQELTVSRGERKA